MTKKSIVISLMLVLIFSVLLYSFEELELQLDRITSRDASIRADAAREIYSLAAEGEITKKDKRVIPVLRKGLKDQYYEVRFLCAKALAKLQDFDSIKLIGDLVLYDKNITVKEEACNALADLKHINSMNLLIAISKKDFKEDTNGVVKRAAIKSLGDLGFKNAVPTLIGYLKSTDVLIVQESVMALGKLKDKRAVKPLAELYSKSDSSELCLLIEEALDDIGVSSDEKEKIIQNKDIYRYGTTKKTADDYDRRD